MSGLWQNQVWSTPVQRIFFPQGWCYYPHDFHHVTTIKAINIKWASPTCQALASVPSTNRSFGPQINPMRWEWLLSSFNTSEVRFSGSPGLIGRRRWGQDWNLGSLGGGGAHILPSSTACNSWLPWPLDTLHTCAFLRRKAWEWRVLLSLLTNSKTEQSDIPHET